MKTDVIVLGAGFVGITAALALQARGLGVVVVDRRGVAEETSFGNTGLIQREGIVPYAFPRKLEKILTAMLNRSAATNLHWSAVPWLLPSIVRYWHHGAPERIAATARAMRPIVERSLAEHEPLFEAAGITPMMRRTGYIKIYRDPAAFDAERAADEVARRDWGVVSEVKTNDELHALEPGLTATFAGGFLMPQPVSVADPAAVCRAFAEVFVSRGGKIMTADATTLEPTTEGWQVARVEGALTAPRVVVALGPWSGPLLARLGVGLPHFVKRGYHMHYKPAGNATLSRPVIDGENGYVITPMTRGVRLTTGAEFAPFGTPATPIQLDKTEAFARGMFPLADRVDPKPWLGSRPCLPDLVPVIGEVPGKRGLWVDSAHHHLGFTLSAVSARLLAELMTGEAPFTDPTPYRVSRFS